MTIADLEQRLALVERQLATLRAQLPPARKKRHPLQTLEKIHATFDDADAYLQAARLGRQWRNAQRDPSAKRPAKRKAK
jgi:hypothetical protein